MADEFKGGGRHTDSKEVFTNGVGRKQRQWQKICIVFYDIPIDQELIEERNGKGEDVQCSQKRKIREKDETYIF